MNNPSQQQTPVWFVTGASNGIGLELVSQLLKQGHRVAATSRDADRLRRKFGTESTDFLPLTVHLASEASVGEAIKTTVEQFSRIDVVVNIVGFRLVGSLEAVTDEEARTSFDINVFGMLNVIRQVMPHLRQQRSGHIVNFSSVSGITGTTYPGWGVYCATKFAVEGLSEALAAEVAPFGIKVTIVEPGGFHTNFVKSDSLEMARNSIEDYALVRQWESLLSQLKVRDLPEGELPNDPAKAAAILIQITGEANPPLHLLLGQDAYDMAKGKIKALQDDMESWKDLSLSTGFPQPVA